ncbi:putative transcription factor WD40-like family [Helianthus anomalus]
MYWSKGVPAGHLFICILKCEKEAISSKEQTLLIKSISFRSISRSSSKGLLLFIIFVVKVKSKLKGHSKRIIGLAFSHVLNVLVSSGADAQVIRMDGKNKRHDTFNSNQGEHRHHNPTRVCSFIMIRPIFFLFTRLNSPSMNRQN